MYDPFKCLDHIHEPVGEYWTMKISALLVGDATNVPHPTSMLPLKYPAAIVLPLASTATPKTVDAKLDELTATAWFASKYAPLLTTATVKVNDVVFVTPPPVAVTVTVLLLAGVEANVLIVSVVVQVGPQDVDEKFPVAPVGNPETENATACDVPDTRVAVIPFATTLPCVTDIFPPFDKLILKAGALTVKVNDVVFVTPPPVAVTVTVLLPAGVAVNVLIVSVVVQVGPQDVDEKFPVAPVGNPETENETACDVPDTRVAVIPFVTEFPCVTDLFPLFDKLKLKPEFVVALAVLE